MAETIGQFNEAFFFETYAFSRQLAVCVQCGLLLECRDDED